MCNNVRRTIPLVLMAAVVASTACERAPTGPDAVATPMSQVKVEAGMQAVEGRIGTGNMYGLYLPAEWNGDLVLYAHGYCGVMPFQNSPEACYPANDEMSVALRDRLMAQGYAVAWSSYSDWGMAVKDGEIRTAQLKGLFTSRFGRPAHTYLVSISAGGAMTMHLAEQHPQLYDGALPICGIIGGMNFQMSYYWNMKALVNYYFPGVVPAGLVSLDEFLGTVAPALGGAVFSNFDKALDLASIDQVELKYNDPNELFQDIMMPIIFATNDRFAGDMVARLHGRNFFDNRGVVYTGSADDEALNDGIARFTADPDALNLLNSWYQPTGNLKIKVLTLHTARDPVVSWLHQQEYARLVALNGNPDLLAQRIVDRFGHCAFSAEEQAQGLFDLAAWVKTGVRPAT